MVDKNKKENSGDCKNENKDKTEVSSDNENIESESMDIDSDTSDTNINSLSKENNKSDENRNPKKKTVDFEKVNLLVNKNFQNGGSQSNDSKSNSTLKT